MTAPIRAAISGSTCTADGLTATASAPVLALCRALAAAGHDPAQPLHAYRDSVLALAVTSIGWGARHTVRETATDGPRLARWQPFPAGRIRPEVSGSPRPCVISKGPLWEPPVASLVLTAAPPLLWIAP